MMTTTKNFHFLLLLFSVFFTDTVVFGAVVRLDVGGTVFKTTVYTLTKFDGTLKTLVDSYDSSESSASFFIDRSPEHFDVILNFLRDGDVVLPESEEDVREILKEAEYFELDGLGDLCRSKIPQDPSYELRFIESDTELLQIITSPEKPVIIFYFPVTVAGKVRYPEDLEVKNFLDKYDDDYAIYLKPYKMKGTDREEWMWSIHKNDNRADFKYHRHNYPKQSFIVLFEESLRGF